MIDGTEVAVAVERFDLAAVQCVHASETDSVHAADRHVPIVNRRLERHRLEQLEIAHGVAKLERRLHVCLVLIHKLKETRPLRRTGSDARKQGHMSLLATSHRQ